MFIIWQVLILTFKKWSQDKVPQLGAALAFYAALSIAPLLVIALRVAAMFFGQDAASGELIFQMQLLVGDEGSKAIQDMIANANRPATGTWATVLSIGTMLFAASGVFGQLVDSMNTIWEVKPDPNPNRAILDIIRDRFMSFLMVLGIAALLLLSLLISATLSSLGIVLDELPDSLHWLARGIHLSISTAVITVLFAMMFKFLPDVKVTWSDVWLGAGITAVLFSLGTFVLGFYFAKTTLASSYGVAGSFVVFLVWVYYSAQIFYLGAEFTQVYANHFGSHFVTQENHQRS